VREIRDGSAPQPCCLEKREATPLTWARADRAGPANHVRQPPGWRRGSPSDQWKKRQRAKHRPVCGARANRARNNHINSHMTNVHITRAGEPRGMRGQQWGMCAYDDWPASRRVLPPMTHKRVVRWLRVMFARSRRFSVHWRHRSVCVCQ